MAYIGKQPTVGNFVILDSITTSATDTFALTSGSVAYSPASANHCIVSLNGVIQAPISSFTISGSNIVFASALTATDVIDFIQVLGDVLNVGTPTDGTVTTAKIADGAVTGAKLASGAGGKLLQVVSSGAINAGMTSTATSYTAVTSHSLAITPSSTSSKIFILMSFSARSSNTVESHYTLYRDSTNLGGADGFMTIQDDNASSDNENQCTLQFLDSPNTTSEVTYALYGKTDNGSNSFRVNIKGNDSVITLFEIGA